MNNLEILFAIIGVVITLAGVIIGVYYTRKQNNTPHLTLIKNSCISLFKSTVKDLDDIEIRYQGKIISDNLILFKGTFFNNGNIDIDNSIVHKPLTIFLPEHYSWKRNKIIDSSEGLDIQIKEVDNSLEFYWELFKEGEYFTFDSLIEYQTNQEDKNDGDFQGNLFERINFRHRITNLRSITKENTIPIPKRLRAVILTALVLLTITSFGLFMSIEQFLFPQYEIYQELLIDSTLTMVKIEPDGENSIELQNQEGKTIMKTSPLSYSKLATNNITIKKMRTQYIYIITGSVCGLLYLFLSIRFLYKQTKKRKLYNKLKTIANKYDSFELSERHNEGLVFID